MPLNPLPKRRWSLPGRRLLLAAALVFAGAPAAAAAALVFAVHPYLASSAIEQHFAPLVRRLSNDIGLPITLRVSTSYDAHIQAVGEGKADFAYIGPAELLLTEARYGRRILLGQVVLGNRRGFSGHLVGRRPAASRSGDGLAALRGQRIAFVDRQSTMGYLVPMAVLKKAGIGEADFRLSKFVGSHDNVALGVLAGDFEVGAVKDETYEKFRSHGLHSLLEMPVVPEHVFVASPRVPAEWRNFLQHALLKLADDEAGKDVLRTVRPDFSRVARVERQDLEPLRQLLGVKPAAAFPGHHTP